MIRPLALLTLLATPSLAQDADPANQLTEGYLACMSGGGQVDLTQAMLVDALQWTRSDEGEDGLVYFYPGAGEATFVFIRSSIPKTTWAAPGWILTPASLLPSPPAATIRPAHQKLTAPCAFNSRPTNNLRAGPSGLSLIRISKERPACQFS